MSQTTREEMLPRLRQRYRNRGREGKTHLINELCDQWGYSRKHAIKLLNGRSGWGGSPDIQKGRPVCYGKEVAEVVGQIWLAADQPCGKRLKPTLALWLPYFEQEQGPLALRLKDQVLQASPATLDRLLAPWRVRHPSRGACGTKPGTLLRTEIPIRTDNWDIRRPGYLEADTVAHCGPSMAGDFIWSVTLTDVYSGWTLTRAVWNRGATDVVACIQEVEALLPFEILGFDCDNGSEFLNWHLVNYFRRRPQPVGFTRSRPYHKDDNGHVEQKNWTRVRQLVGYDRLEDPQLVEPLNELYRRWWDPLCNFYLPSAKLAQRYREGSRIVRRHDEPRTPCQRILESAHIRARTKRELLAQRDRINPFEYRRQLEQALRPILLRGRRSAVVGRPERPPTSDELWGAHSRSGPLGLGHTAKVSCVREAHGNLPKDF